jgi:hypothetical protein
VRLRLSVCEIIVEINVKSCSEAVFMHISVAILLRVIFDTILCQGQTHVKVDEPVTFNDLIMIISANKRRELNFAE